jgi:hypothetical protein
MKIKIEAAQRLMAAESKELKKLKQRLKDTEGELDHKNSIYMDMEDEDADQEIKELEKAIAKLKKAIKAEEKKGK